jgi:uncharacterized protein (TIGR02145 family)
MMKKLYLLLIGILLLGASMYAQTPQAINYQGVARDNSGNVLVNQAISLRLSILTGSATGTAVYVETHATTTDGFGLFALHIGQGTVVSGAFGTIDWGSNSCYLKVEIDPAGGTTYQVAGTSQFASVPYALYAQSSGSATHGNNPGDMLYWNGTSWVIIPAGSNGQQLIFCNGVPTWGGCTPQLITDSVTAITATSATCGGNVTDNGGSPVTARGVCWNTSPNPTIVNSFTTDGSGTGAFVSNLAGLIANTLYYVRAYATNSVGTAYGNEVSFTTHTAASLYPVMDIDGNGYDTIHISTQIWLKQNLKTTHYRNGDPIPNVTDGTTWMYLTTGAYCNYNNDANNSTTYGRLYNWYAVGDSRNIAPTGWHIATDAEWTTLTDYLGGASVAGGKLKEAGYTHWLSPNIGATNETGFTALPGGYRHQGNGEFYGISDCSYWWSSTEGNADGAWGRGVNCYNSNVYRGINGKEYGYSVRCVRD